MAARLRPGRLRALNYAADIPALLPLLRDTFVRAREDPADAQTLRHLARAAAHAPQGPTTEAQARRGRVPFFGWVWEDAGRVVGLIALLGVSGRPPRYVFANIVVHPDYRGRGIGRALVRHALAYVRARRAEAWLEVEEDNLPARRLYRSLGFVDSDRRVDWRYSLAVRATRALAPEVTVRPLQGRDAARVAAWLEAAYPRAYQWRWPPQPLARTMRPGWLGRWYRLWAGALGARLWMIEEGGQPVGVWAWWPEPGSVQRTLYLAASEMLSPAGIRAGLHAVAQVLRPVWMFDAATAEMADMPYHLYLNLPPERHAAALTQSGWQRVRVVWWMRFAGG